MRTGGLAAGILFLATACTSTSAGSNGSTSGGDISTGGLSSSGTASSGGNSTGGTGTTTGSTLFSCDLGAGGLFGQARTVAVGVGYSGPQRALDVGDLNNDGNLDIVAADVGLGDVAVLFGNGDGTFQTPVHSQVPALADAGSNDLGPENLTIATIGSPPGPTVVIWDTLTTSVFVESVEPTGTLSLIADLDAGPGFWGSVHVADVNGDGIPDLAAVCDNAVTVFLGSNSGDYTAVTSLTGSKTCVRNCFGDFNDDGIPDVLVADSSDYMVLLGQADGTFLGGPVTSNNDEGSNWIFGDVNEDGHLDAIAYSPSGQGSFNNLLGHGDGTFTAGRTPTFTKCWPAALRDLNGDGHLDYVGMDVILNNVVIALGNGDGTFQPAMTLHVGSQDLNYIVVGDVNNDGRPDLIVADWTDANITLFINNCR